MEAEGTAEEDARGQRAGETKRSVQVEEARLAAASVQKKGTRRVPRASAPAITLPEAQKVLLWRSERMSKSSEFART